MLIWYAHGIIVASFVENHPIPNYASDLNAAIHLLEQFADDVYIDVDVSFEPFRDRKVWTVNMGYDEIATGCDLAVVICDAVISSLQFIWSEDRL